MALLPDNTPYAILLPATLNTFFQAAEDYYDRWEIMSFIRLIRFVAAFLTVTLPGLYIAFAVYHPELFANRACPQGCGNERNHSAFCHW